MKSADMKYVDQSRAAALLGIPEPDLCRISSEAGLGHLEKAGTKDRWYFTYEELRKICLHAMQQVH